MSPGQATEGCGRAPDASLERAAGSRQAQAKAAVTDARKLVQAEGGTGAEGS